MRLRSLRLVFAFCLLAGGARGEDAPADVPRMPLTASDVLRPVARPQGLFVQRCAAGGTICITRARYAADVCRAIEMAAEAADLDPGYFARLLWRESLFDPDAVSPAGAEGIAQFMPGTAALRHLSDPFNPAEAIVASALYLASLERRFGNLGLAAVAYNGGEARAARFIGGAGGLPGETRAYVVAITGHSAEAWLSDPPPEADLSLEPGVPFTQACLDRAEGRGIPSLRQPLLPWGVILAAQSSPGATERQARQVAASYSSVLGGERIDYARMRIAGLRRHAAQVGRRSRAEAEALCASLRSAGGTCIVLRN